MIKMLANLLSIDSSCSKAALREALARTVIGLIQQEKKLSLHDLQYQFKQAKNVVPTFQTQQHPLAAYNDLIPNSMQGVQHG